MKTSFLVAWMVPAAFLGILVLTGCTTTFHDVDGSEADPVEGDDGTGEDTVNVDADVDTVEDVPSEDQAEVDVATDLDGDGGADVDVEPDAADADGDDAAGPDGDADADADGGDDPATDEDEGETGGLVLHAAGFTTVSGEGLAAGTMRLTDIGFEGGGRLCSGSLCLWVGVMP